MCIFQHLFASHMQRVTEAHCCNMSKTCIDSIISQQPTGIHVTQLKFFQVQVSHITVWVFSINLQLTIVNTFCNFNIKDFMFGR